jgi:DNA polymerase I-like protein with 3'-5' exonuclease and polymerase domains
VVVAHNATFDAKMLLTAGVEPQIHKWDCTAIRACLIDENLRTVFPWTKGKPPGYSLDSLALRYLGMSKDSEIYDDLAVRFGGMATRNVQMPNISRAPSHVVAPYAIRDAELTLRLYQWQERVITDDGLRQIASLERDVIPLVYAQETTGVRVDIDAATQAAHQLGELLMLKKIDLNIMCGSDINVNSPKQVRELFKPKKIDDTTFQLIDGTLCGATATGGPSIGTEVLRRMTHPAAKLIVEMRNLSNTKAVFLEKHILGHQIGGRVYPTINQTASEYGGTGTGRFSYVNPALQQIPNRNKEVAKIVKTCFLPDEGQVWLDCDMNSFEVRVFAHLVAQYNSTVADIYRKDPMTDFHQFVADLMHVPRNPRPEGGANAKQLNLSMIFNSGKGAIAEALGLPWDWHTFTLMGSGEVVTYKKPGLEAERIIELYHARLMGVKELANACQLEAERQGYINTDHGRRIRFPRAYKSYKASGIKIQATSADINKLNWRITSDAIGDRGRLILNTHDSYSFSVDPEHVQSAWKDIKKAVESSHDLRVPLILDLNGTGSNWFEALS